jgi:hypothetical protein
MRIPHFVAALGVAGVLAGAVPVGVAHADTTPQPRAVGNFLYFNKYDGQVALVNPPNDRCLPVRADNIAGPVSNLTDRDAIAFTLPDCTGPAFKISAHSTTYVPFPELRSVLFPAL